MTTKFKRSYEGAGLFRLMDEGPERYGTAYWDGEGWVDSTSVMTYWLWDAREAYSVTAEEAVEFLESGVRGEGSAEGDKTAGQGGG